MKIALVLSDLSFPPREGLHQQSLALAESLRAAGISVDIFAFVKDPSILDQEAMDEALEFRLASRPICYSGSTLLRGLRNTCSKARLLVRSDLLRSLRNGRYDAIHLEGAAAAALAFHLKEQKVVVSMVDPGSRRNFRMIKTDTRARQKLSHLIAAALFFVLERELRRVRAPWHVVSAVDAAYLRRTHHYSNVITIPVALPKALDAVNDSHHNYDVSTRSLTAVIYLDLRQPYNRSALKAFVRDVLNVSPLARSVRCVVLGRVQEDIELLSLCRGMNVEFIQWAPDYIAVLGSADFVILPDRVGTGLKNRAVQCLALAVPILGTATAFEGISVDNHVHAIIGTSADELRAGFDVMVSEPKTRRAIAQAGQRLAQASFGRAAVCSQWIDTYRALTR